MIVSRSFSPGDSLSERSTNRKLYTKPPSSNVDEFFDVIDYNHDVSECLIITLEPWYGDYDRSALVITKTHVGFILVGWAERI